jgi:hypothetical protein
MMTDTAAQDGLRLRFRVLAGRLRGDEWPDMKA